MSEVPEHAIPMTIADIAENSESHLLLKVRTCGKVLSYDRAHAVMVLWSGQNALLIDAKLCVSASGAWLKEPLTTVVVIGYVEKMDMHQFNDAERNMPPPSMMPPEDIAIAEDVRIQALFVKADPHCDIREWEEDCKQLPGYLQRLKAAKSKCTQDRK